MRDAGYPDCYDPVIQAEQREALWDKYIANLPVCDVCGLNFTKGSTLRGRAGDVTLCKDCIEVLEENMEIFGEEIA